MIIGTALFYFLFGIIVGSFLNVLIFRLPQQKSIVFPRSSCPKCDNLIPWYFNIPVLGYLFLMGKCKYCSEKISVQYPIVELATGIVSILLMPKVSSLQGLTNYAFYFSTFCVFICHFIIDLKHKILPNVLNIYLGFLFFTYSFFYFPWTYWGMGFLLGGLFPLAVTGVFYLIKGQMGLGMGDIKLFAVLGIYLGPAGILHNIFLSCFLGAIVGILLILLNKMDKNNPIPFGPYIILVAVIQIFFTSSYKTFISLLF